MPETNPPHDMPSFVPHEEARFKGADGIEIVYYLWLPDQPDAARAVLHIVHGSIEHALRYGRFAHYLTQHGYIVVAPDHRGHGKTGQLADAIGVFSQQDGGWRMTIDDLHTLNTMMQERFAGLPLFMMGHSMGSFLVRHYLAVHGHIVQAAIIMGTGRAARWLMQTAQVVARLLKALGDKTRLTPFMHKLAYGQLNDAMQNPKTDYDFLSRDEAEVQKYIDDPLCGYTISVDYAHELITGLMVINDPYYAQQTRTDVPLLFTSGSQDPVGGEKASYVYDVARMYEEAGNNHITIKIYDGARHEILNEINRDDVHADLLAWLDAQISIPAQEA